MIKKKELKSKALLRKRLLDIASGALGNLVDDEDRWEIVVTDLDVLSRVVSVVKDIYGRRLSDNVSYVNSLLWEPINLSKYAELDSAVDWIWSNK